MAHWSRCVLPVAWSGWIWIKCVIILISFCHDTKRKKRAIEDGDGKEERTKREEKTRRDPWHRDEINHRCMAYIDLHHIDLVPCMAHCVPYIVFNVCLLYFYTRTECITSMGHWTHNISGERWLNQFLWTGHRHTRSCNVCTLVGRVCVLREQHFPLTKRNEKSPSRIFVENAWVQYWMASRNSPWNLSSELHWKKERKHELSSILCLKAFCMFTYAFTATENCEL